MKKLKLIGVFTAVLICLSTLGACQKGESTLLSGASDTEALSYSEYKSDEFRSVNAALNSFQAKLTRSVYENFNDSDNFVISPVSVFMALSLAAESAADNSRNEILNAFNLDYGSLIGSFGYLYRSLLKTYDTGKITVGNSVWLQKGLPVKDSGLNSLSQKMFADVYSADFKGDNKAANLAVRNFVKDKTEDLIDVDFQLSTETLFTLINTLYLSDSWNDNGKDLKYAPGEYSFKNANGSTTATRLLQSNYVNGQIYDGGDFYSFYSVTAAGFKLKFLLPKEGFGISDVLTAENIAEVNAVTDYKGIDEANGIEYMTRVLFPAFKGEFNDDLRGVLQNDFGIKGIFDPLNADFTTLLDAPRGSNYVYKVQHVAKLDVNAEGVEGAAVTVIADNYTSAKPIYKTVYNDFVIDSAFGFVLTDKYDTVLFSGVINAV